MGKVMSAAAYYCPQSVLRTLNTYRRRGEKRKSDGLFDDDEAELIKALHIPKRKKLICTAKYIHQALFKEGKDSDVTVNILGKDWKLHKVYLQQSQYFRSMFSGSWKEANKTHIRIEVEDGDINSDALAIVLGSFYLDEMTIEPCVVVGVLAAATLFQMDGLIEQCSEIMLENISPVTAVQYYQAACKYGLPKVKSTTIEWFAVNLLDYYSRNLPKLKDIDISLMTAIVSYPGLRILQTEMFLYILLRKWMYIKCNPSWNEEEDKNVTDKFFQERDGDTPFIYTDQGMDFTEIFKHIRLDHLLLHVRDVAAIDSDKIIPSSSLFRVYQKQWCSILRISAGLDRGPIDVDIEYFKKECMRCGRVITSEENHSWRWNGFFFGIDLVWSIIDQSIMVQRQHRVSDFSQVSVRNIMIQVDILNLNEKRQIKKQISTDILTLPLSKNQEVKLLDIEKDFEYPLCIFVNLLITSPTNLEDLNTHEN